MTYVCRSCAAPLTTLFADLGRSPLANELKSKDQLDLATETYPLRVFVCDACKLVQLPNHVYPGKIFNENYPYFSGVSKHWVAHFKKYATDMINRLNLNEHSHVLEIGSNDGSLLRQFADTVPVLGVDPSANVAASAVANGIPTRVYFFDLGTAAAIRADYPRGFDLIHAVNTIAHTPDINGLVTGCRTLLALGGTITFEFPHLLTLMQGVQLDTIYHEHYSYFSLLALNAILARNDLRAYDVEQLSTHGGSLRVFICESKSSFLTSPAVEEVLAQERAYGLDRVGGPYKRFRQKCLDTKMEVWDFLSRAQMHKETVVGYGAPAKATALLNFCGVDAQNVPYVVDDAPAKIGKFIPGVDIPIYHPDYLKVSQRHPDHVIVFSWNLIEEIKPKIIERVSEAKIWTLLPALKVHAH